MLQNTAAKKYTYSLRSQADFRCKIIESRLNGTLLNIDRHEVEVLFTGRFNAYNLLAVYGTTRLLGFDEERTLVDMSRLVPVAGRFQTLSRRAATRQSSTMPTLPMLWSTCFRPCATWWGHAAK